MNLPEFPTDEGTLGMLMLALDPGPEAERTSLFDLLELMSQLGGSDTSAVSEVIPGNPLGLDIEDAEIHVMRDPVYTDHDVIRALIKALRETRGEVDDKSDVGHLVAAEWERTYNDMARRHNAIMRIDPADYATKSRDFGRGFSEALRVVREILEAEDV